MSRRAKETVVDADRLADWQAGSLANSWTGRGLILQLWQKSSVLMLECAESRLARDFLVTSVFKLDGAEALGAISFAHSF